MTKLAFIVACALTLFGGNASQAQEYRLGDTAILDPWARPAAEGRNGAVYFVIKNGGRDAERVLSAECPVAEKTELHETRDENGVMKMHAVEEGVEIKPGSSIEFKPGGYHVMLLGLKKPLEAGATVPLKIKLEKAGVIGLDVKVGKTARDAAEAMPMDMHGMKGMDRSPR